VTWYTPCVLSLSPPIMFIDGDETQAPEMQAEPKPEGEQPTEGQAPAT